LELDEAMDEVILAKIEETEKENADFDFKSVFDPSALHDWCELIKDIVAMANSGGGLIVFGVNDDGSPVETVDLKQILSLDPATIVDKIEKYTDHNFADFSLYSGVRRGLQVAVLAVSSVSIPIIFTSPGTYDVGGGKIERIVSQGHTSPENICH
jgi:predicted HTH transcriptional regulator